MRDRVIALSGVGIAGLAIVAGLTIGALGGAFDDEAGTVQPPALRSDLSTAVSASSTSTITVPPSPTWQVAEPTTPRPTTTTEEPTTEEPTSTTRVSATTRADETTEESDDDESEETATSTTR